METYDYLGWYVNADDLLYKRLLEQKIDITKADQATMQKILDVHLKNNYVALDIGCHYGFFTKFLSTRFQQIHAFDFPNKIWECFKMNVKNFENNNHITLHPYGVGETKKQITLNDWFDSKSGRGPLANHIDPTREEKNYNIVPIDSLNLNNCDLMMVDTEGYELKVLEGAKHTISEYRPIVVLEFHPRNLCEKYGYTLKDLHKYITGMGYRSIGYINKVDQVFVSIA